MKLKGKNSGTSSVLTSICIFKDVKLLDIIYESQQIYSLRSLQETGALPSARSTRQSLKNTRQRRLGKQCIGKAFFAEYFFSGTRQRGLPSAREHSAKKSGRYGDDVFAECLYRSTRQRIHLCRVPSGTLGKEPPGRVPMSGSLPSALCGTRQSRPLCRVPVT